MILSYLIIKLLITWVVQTNQSFLSIEAESFKNLFKYLNGGVKLLTRESLRSRLLNTFETRKENLRQQLQAETAKIHLSLDCWTSANRVYSFMAVFGHFLNFNWDATEVLLDFKNVEGRHTGHNLALYVLGVLQDYKITERILSITADNASNMDSLVDCLNDHLGCTVYRGRCTSHILNLTVQAMLGNGGRNAIFADDAHPSEDGDKAEDVAGGVTGEDDEGDVGGGDDEEIIVGFGTEDDNEELDVPIDEAMSTLRALVKGLNNLIHSFVACN
jgi:hypothetical protein